MKISTKGIYGMRMMLSLALHYEKGVLPLKAIAKEQNISEKYLEQIINPLTKAGLVQSFRGAQGGYALMKAPNEITVGQVLRLLEGSLSPVDCVDHISCPNSGQCACLSVWEELKNAIDTVVDRYTLADLVEEYRTKNCVFD